MSLMELAEGLPEVRLMEVCGTHTVSLFRSGLRASLPPNIRLISGPGCPVCVTSQGYIDAALEMARGGRVTLCSYGDMLRVPGREGSLESLKAEGARVQICYSIRDALGRAAEYPEEEVVFLAVGFETTAPATALAVLEAERRGLSNFSVLMGHKRVMPAVEALLSQEHNLHGFLLPGHVSVIIGSEPYRPILEEHRLACAIAGFEPPQLLAGVSALLRQLKSGRPALENLYGVAVRPEGNIKAQMVMERLFEAEETDWRAMGSIPLSGDRLRAPWRRFDAQERHGVEIGPDYDPPGCLCGEVIQGKAEPPECSLFGEGCTPSQAIGPCMVSSEGSCAAWYRYGARG